jgi:V/A-type H+-transporting ATPase subunit D
MALQRVPPGRAGLLWLRHRLAVARRGLDLLQRKQVILMQEEQRLRMLEELTRREWSEADAQARRWLLRAAALGGDRAVRIARPLRPATVTPRWTTVIGVRCAADPVVRLPDPGDGVTLGSPALAAAAAAYRRALPAAARHAAVSAAYAAVRNEVGATRQRVRALERRWIPQLESAMAGIRLQMAELEDADAIRRRRVSTVDRREERHDRADTAGSR